MSLFSGNRRPRCRGCEGPAPWLCLTCFNPACSRWHQGHALRHFEETGHPLGLSLEDMSIWCYLCDDFADVHPQKEAIASASTPVLQQVRLQSCLDTIHSFVFRGVDPAPPHSSFGSIMAEDWAADLRCLLSKITGEIPLGIPNDLQLRVPDRMQHINRLHIKDFLMEEFNHHGLPVYFQELWHSSGQNIISVLPATCGTGPTEVVVIGAHFDSVNCPGADDNGTGVSAVWKIATTLCTLPQRKRAAIFCFFDLEEVGTKGSTEFAFLLEKLTCPIHSVHCVDMIGYNQGNTIAVSSTHDTLLAIYRQVAGSLTEHTMQESPFHGVSDFIPFKNVFPTVSIAEPHSPTHGQINPNHHQKTDTVETLDFSFLNKNIHLICGAIAHILCN
ncbi:M20/M25/M40 family metallo-hydrolase [Pelomyxa schiedti]|nr:M20/M25/M40 family metallo-hydrolase [Pelomyxa schiedti]